MDRSNQNIKSLLEQYWAGESSLEDEKMIYAYFAGDAVAPDLMEFAPLFIYLDATRSTEIDITTDVLEKIDALKDNTNTGGIENVLEKYWAGDSSLEDEQIIKLYFNQTYVAPHFQDLIPYFKYLNSEKNISIDVTEAVMKKISSPPLKTKVVQLGWHRIVSLAASVLLVLSVGLAVFQYQQTKTITSMDTYQSPEEALEQTKAALAYLTARINRGTDKALDGLSKTETLEIINQ